MIINNNLRKLKIFFEDDLKVKKILNDMIPKEIDLYDDDSKFKYIDKLLDCLSKIKLYISRMLLNYKLPNSIVIQFDTKMKEIQNYVNSEAFYQLMQQDFTKVLQFIHNHISNMRIEFIDSVQKGFVGYTISYGNGVLNPITINEFLHYIHSYIVNNEKFYSSIPTIKTTKKKGNWKGISLRGIANDFGNSLYEKILTSNIDSNCIDIINLDNRTLIMARDLGHATVIEIEVENENVFVNYFIPKNNNKEMISELKGINVNKEEFATGNFQTNEENVVQDLCSLMKKIPTDSDRIDLHFGI